MIIKIKDTDKIQIFESCKYFNDNLEGEYIEYNKNGEVL